jgi:ribonuclease BN (tRNA processing enzyme)
MRVTVIGCAGSFPGPDSPASCYLLEAEGFRLVIDLGNGSLGVLQRYAELFSIDAICLSHLHPDHCIDLGAYWVARQFAPDGPKPTIPVHAPRGAAERLIPNLGPIADHAGEGQHGEGQHGEGQHGEGQHGEGQHGNGQAGAPRFDFHDLTVGTAQIGPFRVTTDHMNHPVETFGFRVEHAGVRLAYSADTGPSDALVRLAEGADLLLAEASFLDGQDTRPDLHLTARQAAEHAARAGVGQLVLTHLVPWNDRDRTRSEASGVYPGPLSLATSGLVLEPGAAVYDGS